ncbi:MAG: glycosyltransferase family 39 protein [Candidatus Micrarchaeota archaeon]|nr:glycosyltransferase family 39 protein [Candidatus Micrarchaeota archaeon]
MTLLLIGYGITAAVYSSFVLMLAFIVLGRKDLGSMLRESIDRYSLVALVAIVAFFLIFELVYVHPAEQLYFDENIYQGIALNILNSGNALWCQLGTGYLKACYANVIYHDPVGWAAFIAIAFAIAGIGTQTAYALELLVGALSIVFVFLLASILLQRKDFAVVSALAMAVMPGLLIWSRTQADFDLPFMTLSVLSFFLFVAFIRRKSISSLAAFAFSLVLVSYIRLEAILLVPIFALLMIVFGDRGLLETARMRIGLVAKTAKDNTRALLILLAFIVLLLPEIYYISIEAQNPAYGQPASQQVLSISNFETNIAQNSLFLTGETDIISSYPTVFHYVIFPLAIMGIAALLIRKGIRNRFGILILLSVWFLTYFVFYTSFYAGSVLFGVDSRFMLQILPPTCVLAALGLVSIGDAGGAISRKMLRGRNAGRNARAVSLAVLSIASVVLLFYPFYTLMPLVTLPQSAMPQQGIIYPAITTFYENYSVVPENCLVFSFTPEIWQEVNRSASQVGFIFGSNNQTVKSILSGYSCFVFDYGYWCRTAPYADTTCKSIVTSYKLENLTYPPTQPNGTRVAFYKILNYS